MPEFVLRSDVKPHISLSQTAKAGSRLLIVDESSEESALTAFVLTRELPGAEILLAAHEDSLAEALSKHPPAAVITEYRLSWTDGFHVLDLVRGLLPECPVVMFTGCGNEELVRRALKSGFADYLAKSPRGYLRVARRIEACLASPPSTSSAQDTPIPESSTDQNIELLHAVSHDLQEPLRGISRFSRLLDERMAETDPDMRRYLRHVIEASDRMRAMLDDYLEYLNVGKNRETGENTELDEALDSALGNLRVRIEDGGAVIKRATTLPLVAAGFNDMVRLFQNLLENGLKFRSKASPQIEVSAERLRAVWLLSVKDNGIGIDPADCQRIFQMHRRLHPAGQYPGNGMGLAICKRIVEEYGGRIWVESEPGAGSTFYVTLPPAREFTSEESFETA